MLGKFPSSFSEALLWTWLLASLFGCAGSYILITKPDGAKVYANGKEIGTTPLEFSGSAVDSSTGGGILINVVKQGYHHVWVWMPSISRDYKFSINLTPFYQLSANNSAISDMPSIRTSLYKVTDRMLSLQMALMNKDKVDDKAIEEIMASNPSMGSIHFLYALSKLNAGKKDEGVLQLRDAVRYSPQEVHFLSLLNELVPSHDSKK